MSRLRINKKTLVPIISYPYYVLATQTSYSINSISLKALYTQTIALCKEDKVPQDDQVFDLEADTFVFEDATYKAMLPLDRYDPLKTRDPAKAAVAVYRLALMTIWMHYKRLAAATDGFGDILHQMQEIATPLTYEKLCAAVGRNLLTILAMAFGGFNLSELAFKIGLLCLQHRVSLAPFYAALSPILPTPLLTRKARVAICIPYLPTMLPYFITRMKANVESMIANSSDISFSIQYCIDRVGKEETDYTPWSRVARIRNLMISRLDLTEVDYLLWVDADIVSYPPDFVRRALTFNPGNITAPVVLVENSTSFYDWCGFIPAGKTTMEVTKSAAHDISYTRGRNIGVQPGNTLVPFLPNDPRYKPDIHPDHPFLVGLDCCGAMYLMPVNILQREHTDATYTALKAVMERHKVTPTKQVRFEDHPCFTDHFPVCQSHRDYGGKIYMDLGSVSMHANLPLYGIPWAGPGPR